MNVPPTVTECRYARSPHRDIDIEKGTTLPSRAARAVIDGDALRYAMVTNKELDSATGAAHRDHIRSKFLVERTA